MALCEAAQHLVQIGVSRRGKRFIPLLFFFFLPFPFSWQSTYEDGGEEVEEGAVYHVTLKRVQIHQAANKGARWLGVSEAVAFWKAAPGLGSLLQGAEFHLNHYDISF